MDEHIYGEIQKTFYLSHLVFGNLGSGFEKQVPGFYFQKPGYPGRVSGFQNIENKASKMSQITKK